MASLSDLSGAAMGNAAVYGGGFDPTGGPGATPNLGTFGQQQQQDPYALPQDVLARINAEVAAVEAGNNTQAYDQAYANAMSTARANITQSIGNALTEIGNRQNTANTGLQQLPGQLQQLYGQSTGAMQQQSDNLAAQQKATGQMSYLSAQGAEQPGITAMANANTGAQAAVPTLKLAFDNAFSQQRQDVQTQAASKLADLDNQAAMHTADMAKEASDKSNSLRTTLIEQYYESQGLSGTDSQKAATQYAASLTPGYSGGNGKALSKYLPQIAAQIKDPKSGNPYKAYQDAYTNLQKFHSQFGNRPSSSKYPDQAKAWDKQFQSLQKQMQKRWPNQAQSINLAFYDSGA